jgi:hypothetical protein
MHDTNLNPEALPTLEINNFPENGRGQTETCENKIVIKQKGAVTGL